MAEEMPWFESKEMSSFESIMCRAFDPFHFFFSPVVATDFCMGWPLVVGGGRHSGICVSSPESEAGPLWLGGALVGLCCLAWVLVMVGWGMWLAVHNQFYATAGFDRPCPPPSVAPNHRLMFTPFV